jgi:16S rRNA (uracil1498-N3)-methyltransferase
LAFADCEGGRVPDRFYCPEPPDQGRLTLLGEEARHLGRVLRLGPGDRVEVFDGRGLTTPAEVVELAKERVELRALGPPRPDREAPFRLTLATAVPKGERFDWLVEKATELGVSRLVPLITERSVVDPRAAKLDRLRRVIVESCKQSGRSRLMELEGPTRWTALSGRDDGGHRLLAHPDGIVPAAWPRPGPEGVVTLAVGPEGGFTDAEVEHARARGWAIVGLGATKLRIETAGLAACSAILALCGGWDTRVGDSDG